jgi:hypothetical protein
MKYAYWIITLLFCALLTYSAGMYVINYADVSKEFVDLGFPTWVIYPLVAFKITGTIIILWRNNRSLVEWAYAGFSLNILLALFAHLTISDGDQWGAVVALVLVLASYFLGKKVRPLV